MQKRLLEHVLRDFRRNGLDLDATGQARLRAINEELTQLGQDFDPIDQSRTGPAEAAVGVDGMDAAVAHGAQALPFGTIREERHLRRGTGVALGYPIYVVDIDPASNRVTVGDKSALAKEGLVARQVNFLSSRPRQAGIMKCFAKIRYNHFPVPATLKITGEDEFELRFDEPQHAVTPGQAAVLYDGDIVLGGGWIERAL